MTSVAVIAHSGKVLGQGLGRLRDVLTEQGVSDPIWFEVPKSRKAPARVREAIKLGADLIFVWGGDGSVQRCIDAAVGSPVTLAILPAGTANLLANNLGIPIDLEQAVNVGLHGSNRTIDVGKMNGEHFAVMAGVGSRRADDPRRRRRTEGPIRPCRLHLDRRPTRTRRHQSTPRSASTATRGSTIRQPASSSPTSAPSEEASPPSITPHPTTASLDVAVDDCRRCLAVDAHPDAGHRRTRREVTARRR